MQDAVKKSVFQGEVTSDYISNLDKDVFNLVNLVNNNNVAPTPATVITPAVGTFTRDLTASSGDIAYTGVGFKPEGIIFTGMVASTSISTIFGTGNTSTHLSTSTSGSNGKYYNQPNEIYLEDATGLAGQKAIIKSFDTDGFTLTWTKIDNPGANTANVHYIAFR